jgi:phosphoribosylformylglycinamidine synthase subunit PurSL
MVLSVPQGKLDELLELAKSEDVEASVIGTFGTPNSELVLNYRGAEVGRLAMDFLHHGIPMPRRRAVVVEGRVEDRGSRMEDSAGNAPSASSPSSILYPRFSAPSASEVRERTSQLLDESKDRLLSLLAHPNIASKHWIIRQYDHEVQGGSVVKPLVGPRQVGPSDAAVLRPKLGSRKGVAVGCGLAPQVRDPYTMAVWAIDEAVRNVVAVGADPAKIAILDNFCWPSVDDEVTMGELVRTCEACRDAALAYGIPFISGKDSLHNQFTDTETNKVLRIPNTLLISAIAVIDDVRRCVTSDLKSPDNSVFLLGPVPPVDPDKPTPAGLLERLPPVHRSLAEAIRRGLVASGHDVSDGGPLVAAAEMCIGSGLGLVVPVVGAPDAANLFRERPGRYLVEVPQARFAEATAFFEGQPVTFRPFGRVTGDGRLVISEATRIVHEIAVEQLTAAWRGTLDW